VLADAGVVYNFIPITTWKTVRAYMSAVSIKLNRWPRHRLYLALIIILSLGLNLLCIWWGQHHPDDFTSLALYMLKYRTLKPYHFWYPSLFTYIVLIFSIIPEKAIEVLKLLSSGYDFKNALALVTSGNYWLPSPREYIGPRILTAIIGTSGIYLLYRLGKFCFTTRAGLLAAFLLCTCMGYVTNSHFATADVPVTVLAIAAMWLCLRAGREPTAGNYAAAGLVIGLATSVKYYGIVMICPLLVAHIDGLLKKRIYPRQLLFSVLFVLIGFVVGTPYAILSLFSFAKGALQLNILAPTYEGAGGPPGYITHWKNLVNILGVPLFVITVASLAYSIFYALRYRKIEMAYFWAFILPFYLATGRMYYIPARYTLPIVPFLLLITGAALDNFLNARNKTTRQLCLAVTALVGMYGFLYSLSGDLHFVLDSKRMFVSWVKTNIPEGSTIELTPYCPKVAGVYSSYYRAMAGGRDVLYGEKAENRLYRFALRQGVIWKCFLKNGKMPPEKVIDRAIAYHLNKEEPTISIRPDEEFDYSLHGLHKRAPDYLVINHFYAWRFTGKKESYPVHHDFFSALLNDTDSNYRKMATFRPPYILLFNPPVQFADDYISVYKRIAGPPPPPDS